MFEVYRILSLVIKSFFNMKFTRFVKPSSIIIYRLICYLINIRLVRLSFSFSLSALNVYTR